MTDSQFIQHDAQVVLDKSAQDAGLLMFSVQD